MSSARDNYLHARALLDGLAARGCRSVVISPGSRSTPLAHTAMSMSKFRCYVLMDERGAGFFAMGLSKSERVPAILICTSGTAGANYFPAVVEAAQSTVPLLMLTADRPALLRGTGAPQTIDQTELYGGYARFFAELPVASGESAALSEVRRIAEAAFNALTSQPFGPAHINVPLDEPLAPDDSVVMIRHAEQRVSASPMSAQEDAQYDFVEVAERVAGSLCGLIVAGPNAATTASETASIHYLARKLGWPIFADVLSGLRFSGHPVMPLYDLALRNDAMSTLGPDFVLALGAYPTSKVLNQWLDAQRDVYTLRVQPHSLGQDPTGRATCTLVSDVAAYCDKLATMIDGSRDSLLLEPFQNASAAIAAEFDLLDFNGYADCELGYVHAALRALDPETRLVLANSMAVRYADIAAGQGNRLVAYGMRGANGIDGTIAHAAGIAAGSGEPTLLITGDLALLHDLNSLVAVKQFAQRLTILLLNNNGGGIFHFLPMHGRSEHFEQIHGTPHHLNLRAASELFDLDWQVTARPADIPALLSRHAQRARVIEVVTDRDRNLAAHTALVSELSRRAVS